MLLSKFRAVRTVGSLRSYLAAVPVAPASSRPYTLGKVYDTTNRLPLAKIVATIGPASERLPELDEVVKAGMRIMRINFSHATYEEADLRCHNLGEGEGLNHRGITTKTDFARRGGRNNMRAIMLDTQGPEIRTGSFAGGAKNVELVAGETVVLTTDPADRANQSAQRLWLSYKGLAQTAGPGARILIDDGALELSVQSHAVGSNGSTELVCKVVNSGTLGNKKGVNIPGGSVDLPALSEKDIADLKWGVQTDVDYIAASFIRKAQDVSDIRSKLTELRAFAFPALSTSELEDLHPLPLIISKIESTEGLDNFDDILRESDGIMVARGDLGVEIDMATLALCQKEIVKRCNAAGKPVVVATEMLNSMQKNPRPTRAECTDVANAILDGADCTMLSGESAQGKYPVLSINTMMNLIHQTELQAQEAARQLDDCHGAVSRRPNSAPSANQSTRSASAFAAVQLAHSTPGVKAILVSCIAPDIVQQRASLRELAGKLASFRPDMPVLCVVPDHKTGRMLQFHRAVHPVLVPPMGSSAAGAALAERIGQDAAEEELSEENHMGRILARLTDMDILDSGDKIVMVTSTNDNNLDFSYILDIP